MEIASPSPSQVQCYDILAYAPMMPNLTEAHRDASTYSGLKLTAPPVLQPIAAKHTDKVSARERQQTEGKEREREVAHLLCCVLCVACLF